MMLALQIYAIGFFVSLFLFPACDPDMDLFDAAPCAFLWPLVVIILVVIGLPLGIAYLGQKCGLWVRGFLVDSDE